MIRCLLSIQLLYFKNVSLFHDLFEDFLSFWATVVIQYFSKILLGIHYVSSTWLVINKYQSLFLLVRLPLHSLYSLLLISCYIFPGPFHVTHPIAFIPPIILLLPCLCFFQGYILRPHSYFFILSFNLLSYLSTECLFLMNYYIYI